MSVHYARLTMLLALLLLFPLGWFAKVFCDHRHRTSYSELYDFAFFSWRRMGGSFWEMPLAPPYGRDTLESEIHEKFWSIPAGMIDWRYKEQATLFGEMCKYSEQFEELVEHGTMRSSAGDPIAKSGMFPHYSDRFALFTLLRVLKPRTVIEIGSGDSSQIGV